MTRDEIIAVVSQFASEYLSGLRWRAGQMVPGADMAIAPDIWRDNVLERTMEPQEWLTMALYGAGLAEADSAEIYEICQSLAEWMFSIPGHYRYSIPDEWAETDMGSLWWLAYIRASGDELITIQEAASIAGVSPQAISARISRGTLRGFVNPQSPERQGRRLVRKSDLIGRVG